MRRNGLTRRGTRRCHAPSVRVALTLLASTLVLGLFTSTARAETRPTGDEPNIGDGPVTTGQNIDDRMQPPDPSKEDIWLEDLKNPSGTASGYGNGPGGALEWLGYWLSKIALAHSRPQPAEGPEPTEDPTPGPGEEPQAGGSEILGGCGKILKCGSPQIRVDETADQTSVETTTVVFGQDRDQASTTR